MKTGCNHYVVRITGALTAGVLLASTGAYAAHRHLRSLQAAGNMSPSGSLPGTSGFTLSVDTGANYFNVTGDIGFNALANVRCMRALNPNLSLPGTLKVIVGGTTSELANFAGTLNLANNDYIGYMEIDLDAQGKALNVPGSTRRGNWPSEFETCAGVGLPASVAPNTPMGDSAFCASVDWTRYRYPSCNDVDLSNPDWSTPLAIDRASVGTFQTIVDLH